MTSLPSNSPHLGNVPPFTEVHYPSADDEELFSAPLAMLCTFLNLPPPRFRARVEPVGPLGGAPRWEIEATVHGREIVPATPNITFNARYPSYEKGLESAMQNAFAQVCQEYRGEFPDDSPFLLFGRRDLTGAAVGGGFLGEEPTDVALQFEYMERNTLHLENELDNEMVRADIAEEQAGELKQQVTLQTTELLRRGTAILNMEEIIGHLLYERDLWRYKYDQLQARVANTAVVPAPPPAQAQEEEPEEVEDVPATNTRSRTRASGSSTFTSLP